MILVMGDIQNTQIHSNRKQKIGQPGKGVRSACLMDMGLLWSDDNVLEIDSDGGSCITL